MNRLGILSYGAAIAIIAVLTARQTIDPAVYLYQQTTPKAAALGFAGWLLATLGPLTLSIWFMRLSRRASAPWALHLLFIPCALALCRGGASILFFAADVSGDGSLEGYMLLAASAFLALAVGVHAGALTALGIKRIRRLGDPARRQMRSGRGARRPGPRPYHAQQLHRPRRDPEGREGGRHQPPAGLCRLHLLAQRQAGQRDRRQRQQGRDDL